ncbi:hypothetical protein [Psychroflexus lacisalsi]|uniref:Uncharacterized protein n=1 Tax=Psychroflexus lacisalsi TaxID=503928 RepID=A0ABP3VPL9_9FLAO|nr:hypothetical protein [Psychroflexus lacisalsi]MBZ9620466.1 hypothetical protein [Psychroflexus lacisalsi]
MNNITPEQKAKAEQFIKNNIGLKSYKSNAYGELQMLYDFVKDNDLSKMNDEERSDFFIEISDLKNRLIDWIKDTPQKQYQFENIIFRIKSLYAAFYNIEVFTDIEKNKIELNDAFDFELEPKELKINLLIENAESRILKAINEVESKAEKTSNKSSKKKPIPKFEEVINKKLNWNKKQIETLENELKMNFADIISKSYNKEGRGSKEPLYFAILHLGKKEIIDFEAIEAKKFLRFFVNLFLGENYNWENFEDRDYIGFTQKLREFKNNKNDINTKKYKEQIKPVFEKIEEKHIFIKIADISIN